MQRILLILLLLSGLCFAQNIKVISSKQIQTDPSEEYAYPKFSPQGKQILLSSPDYKGLWIYQIDSGKLDQLNDRRGAGYGSLFSEDGESVIFRYNIYRNGRKFSSLAFQNIAQKSVNTLVREKRNLYPPSHFENNRILFNLSDEQQVFDLSDNTLNAVSAKEPLNSNPVAYTENSNLIVLVKGQKRILNPLGEGHYLWGSISPDKNRILFTLVGKGAFICDIDGNILAELGYANYPNWSPDGKWIVCMQDQDDGHRITGSDIFVISADGQHKFQLTKTHDKIEMHPDWSPIDNNIVYDTITGSIEILIFSIEE